MNAAALKFALAIALHLCGCAFGVAGATSRAAVPATESVDGRVTLRAGESLHAGRGLRIGFLGVTADSRCPRGERCVSAGSATARFWVQATGRPRQTIDLQVGSPPAAGPGPRAAVPGAVLTLLQLDPVPVAGRRIASGEYVATLSVHHGTAEPTDPDR